MPDEDKYDGASEAIAADVKQASSTDSCPLNSRELEDVCQGTMLASLAITDDNSDTLQKIGKANPWHIEALRLITGSEEQAHKPLSAILKEDMGGLVLDEVIDISGVTKGGHFLDTQGYIAHNDDTIVLSYRCTTSAFDWLTNLNTTASEWEIAEDLEQGFSGYCSGFEGWCCSADGHKPRVHTGFYNNFLASLPIVKKHIEPLLAPDQPPRKLFVVGHSLGAGIATLAGCYFLLEHDWTTLPHELVHLTAGSPRACCDSMADVIRARLADQRVANGKVQFYRVVKGRDLVTKVPPRALGFVHLIDPIKIMDDGNVVWKIKDPKNSVHSSSRGVFEFNDEEDVDEKEEMKNLTNPKDIFEKSGGDGDEEEEADEGGNKKYKQMVKKVPRAFRDHMPDSIIKPLFRVRGIRYGSQRPEVAEQALSAPSSESTEENDSEKEEDTKASSTVDDVVEIAEQAPVKQVSTKRKWRLFGRKRKSVKAPQ